MSNQCRIDTKSTPEEGRARRIRGWGRGGLCLINPSQPWQKRPKSPKARAYFQRFWCLYYGRLIFEPTSSAGKCPFDNSAPVVYKWWVPRAQVFKHRWRWIVQKGSTSQHWRCIKISLPQNAPDCSPFSPPALCSPRKKFPGISAPLDPQSFFPKSYGCTSPGTLIPIYQTAVFSMDLIWAPQNPKLLQSPWTGILTAVFSFPKDLGNSTVDTKSSKQANGHQHWSWQT